MMPTYKADLDAPKTAFSTDRAMLHVAQMAQKPHATGFPAHKEVRQYIFSELQKMGLEPQLQEGYSMSKGAEFSKATNILARISGKEEGKALLLLSHYDSDVHSSLGASDAASGVATILEGVRAFLAKKTFPKNDIIILFTDAEELGLNGADVFVNNHPWAADVGLVLNFEARGSGGPSYMLMETNQGNANLIKEFSAANLDFPVTSSLAYSIYKMLPNDTDLTVFREDGDIDGFNFAFIDDHFDYHTEKDTPERLDKNTLKHQGSYLMPLLHYFANNDLTNLKNEEDYIYFNVPVFKMVSYPYSWIWLMFIVAVILFIALIIYGHRKKILTPKQYLKGFIPALIVLVVNGAIGYFSWMVLLWLYPQYQDMLHSFTYNGYSYIAAFFLLSTGICFWVYHKYKKIDTPNLLVVPIFLWLLICGGVAGYLKGGSYFIVPVYALLISLLISINQKKPNTYLLVFLTLPAIVIFAQYIKMFPVALGLPMMVTSTVLTSLVFMLLLSVFGYYKHKNRLAILAGLLSIGFFISAHFNSGFTEENGKPNSLLYVLDADTQAAIWATYDRHPGSWNAQFFEDEKQKEKELDTKAMHSKYAKSFVSVATAPYKNIFAPKIEKTKDTVINQKRQLTICITPRRNVNRLEVLTRSKAIDKAIVNGIPISTDYLQNRVSSRLFTHYISNNEYTELVLELPENEELELTFYESSNDLLNHPRFSVPKRPKDNIPMPFVLNDAILVVKKVKY